MAWIESHTVTLRHRKLTASARELRLKPVYFLGHLHALWHAVLEQQEDGDLSSWSDEMIADAAQFQGDAAKFVSLLLLHRWLDDARTIHDWLDYVGLYLTRKYAKRNKDRLAEIWQKYGRIYGSGERPSDNLATDKQEPFVDGVGRSKDSSKLERAEKRPNESSAAWLAREWLHYRRGANTDHDRKSADNFEDLLNAGLSVDAIAAEIKRKDRAKTEAIWEFCRRMNPPKASKDRLSGSKAFLERQQ